MSEDWFKYKDNAASILCSQWMVADHSLNTQITGSTYCL